AADPWLESVARNLFRRNLSSARKRDYLFELVTQHYHDAKRRGVVPQSNRELARRLRCRRGLIDYLVKELLATGTIEPVEKTKGKDGKARRVSDKPTRVPPPPKCSWCKQRYM